MNVLMTTIGFTISCLAFGGGLFLAAEVAREMSQTRIAQIVGTRAATALSSAALLTVGAYGALLSIPL